MLEELDQDFLVSVAWMLTPLKLLQPELLLIVVLGKSCRNIRKKIWGLFTALVLARLDLLGSHWKPVCSCPFLLPFPQPPSASLFRSPPRCFPPGAKPPLEGRRAEAALAQLWGDCKGKGSLPASPAACSPQGYVRVPSLSRYEDRSALRLSCLLRGCQTRDGHCWTGWESLRQPLSQRMAALLWN